MQTILRSASKEAIIDIEGPFVVIGECINPTGHKKLGEALQKRDFDYVRNLALRQVQAGADVLDVNVGVPGMDEVALLPEVIQIVASTVDVPICIDSANPKALAAGLAVAAGKPLINSVNGEEAMLNSILPIVREYGAAVIGLVMDDAGIPNEPDKRVAVADKILTRADQVGIATEDVVIDPLVMAVGADSNAALVTLQTIEKIRHEFGTNVNLGASNVSFGLPERPIINQAFMALAMGAGATCAITNPMKLTMTIRAVDLLHGRDPYAMRYIGYYRSLQQQSQ
jgi:5-methyltetrahydrofolate--homocysteine methyltransferase